MSTAPPPISPYMYPDRSPRLVLVGAVQVMIGCLCGLMAFMLLGLSLIGPLPGAPQAQSMNMQAMMPAAIFYVVLAVPFIWLGIGLMRARRWAWTLTVVLSWMWLVVGVVSFGMFLFVMAPSMSGMLAQQPGMPREAVMVMLVGMAIFMAGIYIVLPAVFLVLCHNQSARATCLRRDPYIRWTDGCPMPVLALSIMLALSVVSMASSFIYGPVLPLFGSLISGPAAVAVTLLIGLVMAYLAWGTYRLQMAAWWGTLLLLIAGVLSAVITFSRTTLMEMYEKMRMPADQLEMIRKSGIVQSMSGSAPWLALVSGAVGLGYLLYVRRYFVRRDEAPTTIDGSQGGDRAQPGV
jgi:hypothetical protein